ncbi:MAG: periplasmic heavy metal sensor [Desulfobacterales bacterium]|jgi:Spy/CpxP family protein refolding chaperone|nr:periplasmic heavy metal sensor [Desulfobacterales bacterium]
MKMRVLWVVLALALFPVVVSSQMPGRGPRWGAGAEERGCSPVEALELTEAQRQAVQHLDAQFRARALRRWEELAVKRHEIQALLRNPEAEQSLIRSKAAEMVELQNEMHQQMLDHQLEMRSILRPDQIRRWCAGADGLFFSRQRRGAHGAH